MYWIRGALYIVAGLILWYFVSPAVSSLMNLTGNRNEISAFLLFVAFAPLIAGWLGYRAIKPVFRNWKNANGVASWEDRIVQELAPDANRGFPVVIAPWPSEEVRTFALLTDSFESPDGEEQLASIYIPGTPDPSSGALRVVRADKLVPVDWSLEDLLQHHCSFGATGPQLYSDQGQSRAGQ